MAFSKTQGMEKKLTIHGEYYDIEIYDMGVRIGSYYFPYESLRTLKKKYANYEWKLNQMSIEKKYDFNGDAEFPRNLMRAIYGEVGEYPQYVGDVAYYNDIEELEEIFKSNWNEVASTLAERERRVIEMRFQELLNLDECGMELNLTRERIRQIEKKALWKLRNVHRSRKLLGMDTNTYEDAKSKAVSDYLESHKDEIYNDAVESLSDRIKVFYYTNRDKVQSSLDGTIPKSTILDMRIDKMGLSCRSYNCLKRWGLNTVGEIVEMTEDDMMKIRNLGRKSLKEITQWLEENNLHLKWREEEKPNDDIELSENKANSNGREQMICSRQ